MKIPEHITSLSRADFAEIAAATNPTPGLGISIQKKGDSIEFSLDENQFKRMLWAFYHNGGFAAAAADVEAVSLYIQ